MMSQFQRFWQERPCRAWRAASLCALCALLCLALCLQACRQTEAHLDVTSETAAKQEKAEPYSKAPGEMLDSIAADPATKVRVDVPAQTVTNLATGRSERFELNAYKKYCLTNALDDIDYLLEQKDKIEAFERKRK